MPCRVRPDNYKCSPLKSEICPSYHWHPWRPHFQRARRRVVLPPPSAEPRGAACRTQRTGGRFPLQDRNSHLTECLKTKEGAYWLYSGYFSIQMLVKHFFLHSYEAKGKWKSLDLPYRPFLAGLTIERSLHGLPPITRSKGPHSCICIDRINKEINIEIVQLVVGR